MAREVGQMTKFKIGDVLEVFNRDRNGSVERKNFRVNLINEFKDDEAVYFPTDGKQGAYESQLRYESWKTRMGE